MFEVRMKNWIKHFPFGNFGSCMPNFETLIYLCFGSQSSPVAAASANRSGAELGTANKCHK